MIWIGYTLFEYDFCTYVKNIEDSSFVFLLLYMDDMLFVTRSKIEFNKLKSSLTKEFSMKDLGVA